MIPTLVLIGRPNVGKSTLFNRLTQSRDALVGSTPRLTRDRHYGLGKLGGKPYLVIDTGGLEPEAKEGIFAEMAKQTMQAIVEGDVILFIVDGRQGLVPQDEAIAQNLRKLGKVVFIVVNKTEGLDRATAGADFHRLGLGEPLSIAASHGEGVSELVELALESYPFAEDEEEKNIAVKNPKIAIVGRPNVGKSTLINTLLGEERVVVFNQPGTTRDSIYIDFQNGKKHYTLIDTAGIRRKGKVFEALEKFSVVKTLQSIEDANVVILVLDASHDITEQDAHIAGFILETGRALVIAINKWDAVDAYHRELIKRNLVRKLGFLSFAEVHFISALNGKNVKALLPAVDAAYKAAMTKLPTPKLTRVLQQAIMHQAPPRKGPIRPKPRYAHQGGMNPPVVVVHGNALDHIPASYERYLENVFRNAFQLQGTPLRIQFKTGRNPYAEK